MPKPPPLESVQQLHMKASATTNESLASTRRMLALCENSKEAGIRTLVELDDQGDKLDRIETGMTQIHSELKEAKHNLDEMGRFGGFLPSWKKSKHKEPKENPATWTGNDDGKITYHTQPRHSTHEITPAQSGYIARITNDDREDEMDDNLGQVSSMLANLKSMAIDIGTETSTQNRQVDRVMGMAASNEIGIKEANKITRQLLKK